MTSKPINTDQKPARDMPANATGVDKSPVRLMLVQQLLSFLGHNPGPPDGAMGPMTRAALRNFQQHRGLPVDGELSEAVMACFSGVRMMAAVSAVTAPPPLQKAGTTQARLAAALEAHERQDFETARTVWTALAGKGNAEAQHRLGIVYDGGHGVERNSARAAAWYRRAAMQDHARAQTNLGAMYARGEGVAKDYKTAFDLMQRAASQGIARAQLNLGMMYAGGNGTPMNYVQAYMWFALAAERGNESARKSRNALGALMPLSQIVEAKRLAWEWASFTTRAPAP
ncbi:MAG: peptidoglycan-binding protein [Alphaproteobacteria bacterium]